MGQAGWTCMCAYASMREWALSRVNKETQDENGPGLRDSMYCGVVIPQDAVCVCVLCHFNARYYSACLYTLYAARISIFLHCFFCRRRLWNCGPSSCMMGCNVHSSRSLSLSVWDEVLSCTQSIYYFLVKVKWFLTRPNFSPDWLKWHWIICDMYE